MLYRKQDRVEVIRLGSAFGEDHALIRANMIGVVTGLTGCDVLEVGPGPGGLTRALQVLKGFRANQGLLLAGAVAYYALLSLVPLMILAVIAASHWIEQPELLATLGRYLEWLVPGQSRAIVAELANFLAHLLRVVAKPGHRLNDSLVDSGL